MHLPQSRCPVDAHLLASAQKTGKDPARAYQRQGSQLWHDQRDLEKAGMWFYKDLLSAGRALSCKDSE